MTAKTNAERQRDHKARLLMEGFTEVRGIYAKPEEHKAAREAARKVLTPPPVFK